MVNVTLPNTVNSIGDLAFSGCPSLKNFYCYAEHIDNTSITAFSGPYICNTTLYVPETMIDSYKRTSPWSDFGEILPIIGSRPIADVEDSFSIKDISINCLNGIFTIQGLNKGIHVTVFSASGMEMANGVTIHNETLSLNTNIQKGDIAIIKIGTKTIKVMMK